MNRQNLWKGNRLRALWWAGALVLAAGTAPASHGQVPTLPSPGEPVVVPKQAAPLDARLPRPLPVKAEPEAAPPATVKPGIPSLLDSIDPNSVVPPPAATEAAQEKLAGEKQPKEKEKEKEKVKKPEPNGDGCTHRCADGRCVPGRLRECECVWCDRDGYGCQILCNLYRELCCPDPCYEGKWLGVANAAFFVEGTRPVTQTRVRYDFLRNYELPDRNEYFWARSGGGGKGPGAIETSLRASELSLYTEVASKGASVFVNVPYRHVDPEVNPHDSGFGDLEVGFKALWFDRDLLQIGFMFTTHIPTAKPGVIGTGHVSLEPSLLATLKLAPSTYLQGQLSEWIPLGGDPAYEGALLHYHASLNQVLWSASADTQLIGTLEFSGYSFQDGAFSDPVRGQFQSSSHDGYYYVGPGIRFVVCDWLDVGVGAAFAIDGHGPGQVYRTEFRIRF